MCRRNQQAVRCLDGPEHAAELSQTPGTPRLHGSFGLCLLRHVSLRNLIGGQSAGGKHAGYHLGRAEDAAELTQCQRPRMPHLPAHRWVTQHPLAHLAQCAFDVDHVRCPLQSHTDLVCKTRNQQEAVSEEQQAS